jgi:hypothetical protein
MNQFTKDVIEWGDFFFSPQKHKAFSVLVGFVIVMVAVLFQGLSECLSDLSWSVCFSHPLRLVLLAAAFAAWAYMTSFLSYLLAKKWNVDAVLSLGLFFIINHMVLSEPFSWKVTLFILAVMAVIYLYINYSPKGRKSTS